ncbi:chondroitinase-B domain-containing protein [Maribacter hydrothermalis]|uniref:Alginate lyase n=1 Tax=Maribacter hydrothermalis TaxID=1836467 RepID=A0A1B7YXJ1_9FLAO|nr:chondroitinase-B domain-containing protein [Maribacter hydrothermalis]APQ16778.1 alginate lyase [Maribacter hydrothermalis]OBR35205.1 alginate lyase [Maribacter hydrothermalis]
MKKYFFLISSIFLFFSCDDNSKHENITVKDITELNAAIAKSAPGDEIVMANGDWKDVKIKFVGYGNEQKPITLRAETPGKVLITGSSNLKLSGEYLIVDGLHFTNGSSPSEAVIDFGISQDSVANHCKVTNSVILDFNKSQRNETDLWVLFKGRHNELDHCYIAGKSNRGPTVRIDLAGNNSIKNYHKITNNYFGPRPPKGGPSAETIQLGNSFTSMAPSYTLVANNFFDHCNGEVEVISSKTNFNEFRNNVFYKSEGSLVTRHGNYCIIDGNVFIGDENSEQIGGIRLIGTGHWVTNNYFYNLNGKTFRSPLAVMNGIPKSPLNRYLQVTDVVVANNSWVNCVSPWQFGVGTNVDQKDILPASEIRSARPIRTIVANNLIYNDKGDNQPIIALDSIDGINFESNIINNQGVIFNTVKGLTQKDFSMSVAEGDVLMPEKSLSDFTQYKGFEFDQIKFDLFGNSRAKNNLVGAVIGTPVNKKDMMDVSQYGPAWFNSKSINDITSKTHTANSVAELTKAVLAANNGDTIVLSGTQYILSSSLKINKTLTITASNIATKAIIKYTGTSKTAAFEMNPKGKLTLKGIQLIGEKEQYAFASLSENMSSLYNLTVIDSEILDFDFVLKAYKLSFSEYITFKSTLIKNCTNGIEMSEETDDRGEYNAENIFIDNCHFENVSKNVIDYYRGGYDESTVGGNLIVTNSTFTNCGAKEEDGVLLNTYGIINVKLADNKFVNNPVKIVARLWGAKNNTHYNNEITNSGEIIVQENLPLKLMY